MIAERGAGREAGEGGGSGGASGALQRGVKNRRQGPRGTPVGGRGASRWRPARTWNMPLMSVTPEVFQLDMFASKVSRAASFDSASLEYE